MKKIILFLLPLLLNAQSILFNSTTVYDIPNEFDRTTGQAWTIEFWMYINYLQNGTDDAIGYVLTSIDGGDASNRPKFYAVVGATSPKQLFQVYGGTWATDNVQTDNNTLRYLEWHHYAITYSGTDMYLYYDGVKYDSLKSGTTVNQIDCFGAYDYALSASAGFKGNIDELRFWTTARSNAEIIANKDTEIDPATSGLLYYYRFNNSLESSSTANTLLLQAGTTTYSTTAPITAYNTQDKGFKEHSKFKRFKSLK